MGLIVTSNTNWIKVDMNDLYPSIVSDIKVAVYSKANVVFFKLSPNDIKDVTALTPLHVDVVMNGSREWQLDNEGNNAGFPVESVNQINTSGMTNAELLDELYKL